MNPHPHPFAPIWPSAAEWTSKIKNHAISQNNNVIQRSVLTEKFQTNWLTKFSSFRYKSFNRILKTFAAFDVKTLTKSTSKSRLKENMTCRCEWPLAISFIAMHAADIYDDPRRWICGENGWAVQRKGNIHHSIAVQRPCMRCSNGVAFLRLREGFSSKQLALPIPHAYCWRNRHPRQIPGSQQGVRSEHLRTTANLDQFSKVLQHYPIKINDVGRKLWPAKLSSRPRACSTRKGQTRLDCPDRAKISSQSSSSAGEEGWELEGERHGRENLLLCAGGNRYTKHDGGAVDRSASGLDYPFLEFLLTLRGVLSFILYATLPKVTCLNINRFLEVESQSKSQWCSFFSARHFRISVKNFF